MRTHYCEALRIFDKYRHDSCGQYKKGLCALTDDKCEAPRYVRADVAMRHARMRERSTAIRFAQWYAMKIYRCEDVADSMLEYDAYKVKEAQQAAQREA